MRLFPIKPKKKKTQYTFEAVLDTLQVPYTWWSVAQARKLMKWQCSSNYERIDSDAMKVEMESKEARCTLLVMIRSERNVAYLLLSPKLVFDHSIQECCRSWQNNVSILLKISSIEPFAESSFDGESFGRRPTRKLKSFLISDSLG